MLGGSIESIVENPWKKDVFLMRPDPSRPKENDDIRSMMSCTRSILVLLVSRMFKRMFKKKVRKKKKKDHEGGLTKKELEDWAKLQQVLKNKEGRIVPDEVTDDGRPPGKPKDDDLKQGYNYLFEEQRPVMTYTVFFKTLKKEGLKGLCITHTYPQKIRDTYKADLGAIPIYWLSDWYGASQEFLTIGVEERTLRPTRLDFEIMKEISNFMKKNKGKGILLLDGIEALVLANSFEKVVSFLTNINNMASANQCTILAPINPGVFRKRDRFILQKIFDDVRTFVDEAILRDDY